MTGDIKTVPVCELRNVKKMKVSPGKSRNPQVFFLWRNWGNFYHLTKASLNFRTETYKESLQIQSIKVGKFYLFTFIFCLKGLVVIKYSLTMQISHKVDLNKKRFSIFILPIRIIDDLFTCKANWRLILPLWAHSVAPLFPTIQEEWKVNKLFKRKPALKHGQWSNLIRAL